MDGRKKLTNRTAACKMIFMRRTAAYTKWDHKTNEDTLDKLQVKPMIQYIQNYRRKWKERVNRMNTGWIPKQILNY